MCNLCGTPEEIEKGRKAEEYRAESLERMARFSRDLSMGRIKPHTDEMKQVTTLAKLIIRDLVEEYI